MVYDTQDDHMSGSKLTAIFSPSGSYPLQPWLVVQRMGVKEMNLANAKTLSGLYV